MATLNTGTLSGVSIFTGTYELIQSGGTTFRFDTANKYLNKDILFEATVKTTSFTVTTHSTAANNKISWNSGWITANSVKACAATVGVSSAITITPTITTVNANIAGAEKLEILPSTSVPISGYYIPIKAITQSATINLGVSTITTGFLGNASQININDINRIIGAGSSSTYYVSIPEASITINGAGSEILSTISSFSTSVSGATQLSLPVNTTAPSNNYYVAIKPYSSASTVTLTPTINTPGYINDVNEIGGSVSVSANTGSAYYVHIKSATPAISGGGLTNTYSSINYTNASFSNSNNSGISITPYGQAGRAQLVYSGAAEGWVNIASGTAITGGGAISSSTWNGSTQYLTGVELSNGKSFNITVPNGGTDKITFHFSVDNNGNTTIT